jgi:hypothetical protein
MTESLRFDTGLSSSFFVCERRDGLARDIEAGRVVS